MNSQFHLLPDGIKIRRELSAMVAGAVDSICVVMYIFSDDTAGHSVMSELANAARRGVRVKLIIDGFGSAFTPDRFFAPLSEAGGRIQRFNTGWHPRYWFRNHQKFVIADGRSALTGGFNIGDPYFGDGIKSGWREAGIRVDGFMVGELQDYFSTLWNALARGIFKLRDLTNAMQPVCGPVRDVEWVISCPAIGQSLYSKYLGKDLSRSSRLSVVMGYFIPTASLRRTIGKISRRGKVVLVLSHTTDVPFSRHAAGFTFRRMLRDGCEIYEYHPRPLHAKLIVIDDIVYIGSTNIDVRSLHLNFEMSLRIPDAKLAVEALQLVQNDIGHSARITQDIYDRNSSIFQRFIRRLSYTLLSRFDYFFSRKFLD